VPATFAKLKALLIPGARMILTFLLALLSRSRPPRYVWSPALDLDDPSIYSTLLPRAQ
jgi:hypothetical protein